MQREILLKEDSLAEAAASMIEARRCCWCFYCWRCCRAAAAAAELLQQLRLLLCGCCTCAALALEWWRASA